MGMYYGENSPEAVKNSVEQADLVLNIGGAFFNDLAQALLIIWMPEKIITMGMDYVQIGNQIYNPVMLRDILAELTREVKKTFPLSQTIQKPQL